MLGKQFNEENEIEFTFDEIVDFMESQGESEINTVFEESVTILVVDFTLYNVTEIKVVDNEDHFTFSFHNKQERIGSCKVYAENVFEIKVV
ncbi:hypothetical protein ACQUY5_32200 [Bacillus cereus]|uniref:hypothetical protein n=1 Tax=Bacillus cereus TaxID=1396 RepID=UPI003D184D92